MPLFCHSRESGNPGVMVKLYLALLFLALPASSLAPTPCWGADKAVAQATITLDATNEPLRSVLGKITRATKWKIKVPDQWLDKPVSQSLKNASLEEGLKAVLNSAGADNLLLMYDEKLKVVSLFDTEGAQKQSAASSSAHPNSQTSIQSVTGEPDPVLQRAAERASGAAPTRASRRIRRQSTDDD